MAVKNRSLGKQWGWIMLTGFVYVILGVIAFATPVESTFGLTLALAILLLVGGAMRLVQTYKLRHFEGSALRLFQSIVAIIIGALMLRYPEGGALGLALALSFYFLISATLQWLITATMPPVYGRGWGYVSAIASLVLGLSIIFAFPSAALWVPGALLGIDLILAGAAMIGIASSVKRVFESQRATVTEFSSTGSKAASDSRKSV